MSYVIQRRMGNPPYWQSVALRTNREAVETKLASLRKENPAAEYRISN